MSERIEEGDTVRVHMNGLLNILAHKAKVLHKPVATGDQWVFKDLIYGTLHHTSDGCTVTLLEKKK